MPDWTHQVVTWLLVIAGWIIVHYLTVTRERQKEVRDEAKTICREIHELELRATNFHRSPTHDFGEAQAILSQMNRISSALASKPLSNLGVAPAEVRRFRQSVTLRNFDPRGFEPQTPDSALIRDIGLRSEQLAASVNECVARRYLDHWWQTFRP